MSAGAITVRVDDAAVIAMLQRLNGRMADLTPAMRAIGQDVRESSMRSFDEQRSPDGQAWRPLSAAAITARARTHAPAGFAKRRAKTIQKFATGAKALLDTGKLRNSIQITQVTGNSVTIGTREPYAAIHQFGGKAGRGRKVTIPARPYMGLDARASADIINTLRQYVLSD